MLARLALRLLRGAPAPAAGRPELVERAAPWGHWLIYAMLLAVPLGGAAVWLLGLRDLGELHEFAGNALLLIAGAHATHALLHHYMLRDGTLLRMMRPGA